MAQATLPDVTNVDLDDVNRAVVAGTSGAPAAPKNANRSVREAPDTLEIKTLADLMEWGNPDEFIETILARARYAADYRRDFEEEWRRCIYAYFQRLTTVKEASWESQRYMPMIHTHVETALPIIAGAVLDGDKIAGMKGLTPEGKDAATALEILVNFQAKGPSKTERAIVMGEWWGLVTGTTFFDVDWDYRKQTKRKASVETHPITGVKSKVLKEAEWVVADHPITKPLNPLAVYCDPEGSRGADNEWYVLRGQARIGELRAVAGKGHIDKVALEKWLADMRPQDQATTWRNDFDSVLGPDLWRVWLADLQRGAPKQISRGDDSLDDDKMVELLIYRSKSEFVTLGSTTHLIGYSVNPHDHQRTGIVCHPFFEVPDSPYGRSLAGILLDHQELLNENINIFMDVTKIDLLRPFVIDRSLISVLDEDTIVEPNSFIRAKMNAKDAIVPLPMAAPSNLAMLMDSHIKRDADDTSGFTEQARGITSSQGQTATQFNGVQANIINRLKMHVMRMKWMVEDVAQLMVELNQQYMTQAQIVSYIGEAGLEWRKIEPWEIAGDVIVHATTSARHANPDLYAQRVIQLTQVLLPVFAGQIQLNPPLIRWLRVVLQACQIEEVDEIFPKMPNGVRSPIAENIGMLRGLVLHPHPAEAQNGMSQGHIQSHTEFLMQIKDDPTIPESVKLGIQQHIQEHMEDDAKYGMALQAQQQAQQNPGMAGAQGGGTSPQQTGTMAGQAAGSGGVPGVASPGPAAAAGRPM